MSGLHIDYNKTAFVPEIPGGDGVVKQASNRAEFSVCHFTVTKHQWHTSFGADLDLELRRRVVATNIGVESTAREACQHGYQRTLISDVMTTFGEEELRTTEAFRSQF
ncbi:isochorismatase family protein [Bacillus sp. NSP9.1]|nr:isochorismatase family protein [Bacillus sp. NSP9.1]